MALNISSLGCFPVFTRAHPFSSEDLKTVLEYPGQPKTFGKRFLLQQHQNSGRAFVGIEDYWWLSRHRRALSFLMSLHSEQIALHKRRRLIGSDAEAVLPSQRTLLSGAARIPIIRYREKMASRAVTEESSHLERIRGVRWNWKEPEMMRGWRSGLNKHRRLDTCGNWDVFRLGIG